MDRGINIDWLSSQEKIGRRPESAHPRTQRPCYRCSLPGLAELTVSRHEGTEAGHH